MLSLSRLVARTAIVAEEPLRESIPVFPAEQLSSK